MSVRRGRTRWFVAAAAAVLAGVVAVALAWFVVIPTHRPALAVGEVHGIDVSHHQGPIDWRRISADGISTAYIKATEGRGWVDSQFAANWTASRAAGVRRGAYHFFTLCAPGAEQAANFLRTAPPDPEALPPALDLEILNACSDPFPDHAVAGEVDAFVRIVEQAWRQPLLVYARGSWTDRYSVPQLAARPQWRTSFFVRPRADWAVWQVHYFARVDGIEGRVDLDVVRVARL